VLREIDHRINNNMQMVSSLLQLQANYIEDPKLLEPFQQCHDRIRTMALVHQRLHRAGSLAQINFHEYLETLMDMLVRAHRNGVNVRPKFEMDAVVLGIDTAIPLGLIAGELISNSLKHAFAGRSEGVVRVSLRRRNGDQFRLAIGDDGCGATEGILKGNSLGLRLVKILTGQIRGQMEYKNENGAEFVIEFKDSNSN
jgi:two-component sensor histidine kinase